MNWIISFEVMCYTITALLLLSLIRKKDYNSLFTFGAAAIVGFTMELLAVAVTDVYYYNPGFLLNIGLAPKQFPVFGGLMWGGLTVCGIKLANKFQFGKLFTALTAGMFIVTMDVLLDVVAIRLDGGFWTWVGKPINNQITQASFLSVIWVNFLGYMIETPAVVLLTLLKNKHIPEKNIKKQALYMFLIALGAVLVTTTGSLLALWLNAITNDWFACLAFIAIWITTLIAIVMQVFKLKLKLAPFTIWPFTHMLFWGAMYGYCIVAAFSLELHKSCPWLLIFGFLSAITTLISTIVWEIPPLTKACLDHYAKHIKTEAFQKYEAEDRQRGMEVHQQYLDEEHPEWKSRTDYYDDSDTVITKVVFCDILTNDGIAKLLRKLHSLPKKYYSVDNRYKKPAIKTQYDYVQLQYSHVSTGRFAEIKFLKDKYISCINIDWTQLNNCYAFLEYTIRFKTCLNNNLYTEFMVDNLYSFSPRDYSIYYYGINSVTDTDPDYMMVQQMHSEFFPLLCQHYITTLLYSEQGEKNQLACLVYQTRKQPIEIDKMYLGDLSVSFYNKEENYVISAKYDGIQYCVNAGGNHIPNFNLCYYISKYRNEFYYRFLGNMEMKLFERDFSELSNGRKRITYNKKFRQLITKIKSLAGHEYKYTESFDDQFAEKWEFYISNEKSDINTYFHDNTKEFKSILEENFQHLKLLTELNYSKSNWIVAVIAAIASVLATIISLIALLPPR